jgi:hypothetical protein
MLILLCLASFSNASWAQQLKYDLPANDYLPKEKFVDKFFALLPYD